MSDTRFKYGTEHRRKIRYPKRTDKRARLTCLRLADSIKRALVKDTYTPLVARKLRALYIQLMKRHNAKRSQYATLRERINADSWLTLGRGVDEVIKFGKLD